MAGIIRFRAVQKLIVNRLLTPVKHNGILPQTNQCSRRAIGTTNALRNEAKECTPKKKPWVSYGFDFKNEEVDRHMSYSVFFATVSVGLTVTGFILMYLPDFRQRDWALREAYLELRRRESLGLPPIDHNLIDPAKVKLPTDEELGNQEIII